MKGKNVATLEELIRDAADLGVRLVACDMTTDLIGVKNEQLLPEVTEIGGVGTCRDAASEATINLFI